MESELNFFVPLKGASRRGLNLDGWLPITRSSNDQAMDIYYSTTSSNSVPSLAAIAHPSAASIQVLPLCKSAWQHEVAQSDLPFNTKGLLLLISVEWMDAQGGSCFPSEQQIMAKAGISRPALTGHIHRAVDAGFIEVTRYGRGLKNRRYNYQARLPGELAPPLVAEEGKDSFPSCPGEGQESFASLTMLKINHTQERAASEPAPLAEPAPVTLSEVVLRAAKTSAPDGVPQAWIEAGQLLRPNLPVEAIQASAEVFLDHHRAKGTVLTDWLPAWRNWLRRERAQFAHKPLATPAVPSPYASPNFGQVAQETAQEAAARFAATMARYGATPGEGGTWNRPGAAVPLPAPIPTTAADPLPRPRPRVTADQARQLVELAAAGISPREVAAALGRG